MPEPLTLTILTGLASSVSAVVNGLKFLFDLKNAPENVKACLHLIARVDKDLQCLISLRTNYVTNLDSMTEVLIRVDGVIHDAYESLQSVSILLEGCRREAHGGQTPFKGRVKWVLEDSAAFQQRTMDLSRQHATILHEITHLNLMRSVAALHPLRTSVSGISLENLGMIPLGKRRSSSNLSIGDRPGMNHNLSVR